MVMMVVVSMMVMMSMIGLIVHWRGNNSHNRGSYISIISQSIILINNENNSVNLKDTWWVAS